MATPGIRQAVGAFEFAPFLLLSLFAGVWVGAVLGGALGQAFGLWPTLMAMAVCSLLAPLWVVFSPVRALRVQPASA